ncbi:conserved Plasmodium protein, unknown function [Plasmodium gallinaceum]|uniref:Transporter n=1 Tax=Plasmodium gallinaceum TaxID=5849 RepID=A0A1J1GUT6_PLAGA|nr:conserved Plasmodium protein, unknown function [Plasmodium gallinaceum]CRG96218.1 conserved Plasmodium protein, unknown function [Plasmodium gallinaceum]
MSEYKIRSAYFSNKNKVILLICVIFFSFSTHVFKNLLPFLFMLTDTQNESKIINSVVKTNNLYSGDSLDDYKEKYPNELKKNGKLSYKNFFLKNKMELLHSNYIDKIENNNFSEEQSDINSKSIYLYSNILSLIYFSSLMTYFLILFFDLSKKNYILNIFYIVNLISHCFIFIILSNIQTYNSHLNSKLYIDKNGVNLFNSQKSTMQKIHPNIKKDINLIFKNNLKNKLNFKNLYITNNFENLFFPDKYFLFIMQLDDILFHQNKSKHLREFNKESSENKNKSIENTYKKNYEFVNQKYNINGYSFFESDKIYYKKYLKFLYFFIIVSSICSGYLNIYQKKILYCVFYINIGVITSFLILMNSIFKLLAHSLNYLLSNTTNGKISDYIILFLFIDIFGLIIVLIFTYKWSNQKILWINLHKIFYNYQYICFYCNNTYYIYTVDKNIDNILVNIDLCADKNIDISFCAYTNLEKSVFYEYFILNKFRNNKLRIIEIKDKNLKINTTYKSKNNMNENKMEKENKGIQKGKIDSYKRKQNHSLTMKPYIICIDAVTNLITQNQNLYNKLDKDDNNNNITELNINNNINSEILDNYKISNEDMCYDNNYVNDQIRIQDSLNKHSLNGQNDLSSFPENEAINSKCINYGKRSLLSDSVNFLSISDIKKKDDNNNFYNTGDYFNEMENKSVLNNIAEMKEEKNIKEKEEKVVKSEEILKEPKNNIETKNPNFNTNSKFIVKNDSDYSNKSEDYSSKIINTNENINYKNEDKKKKKNIFLIPNYEETDKYLDYDEVDSPSDNNGFSLFYNKDKEKNNIKNGFNIFQKIKTFLSSFTFFFFFFIFIYAFLLSIIHIFINYFFYIYLFVYNINIYISNVYTIIMACVSLIAIPFSGYIIDNIGSFLSLLLCSSFFILIAISGSIYCYKFNLNSEVLAFLFFNLIGISQSIIPTVIISQIPTHLCVKNNESITSAFAIFELVSMIIISLNNYIFGSFLIKKEYLKGLYILFVFIILVIILILLLIVTFYIKKKKRKFCIQKHTNIFDLTQPLI